MVPGHVSPSRKHALDFTILYETYANGGVRLTNTTSWGMLMAIDTVLLHYYTTGFPLAARHNRERRHNIVNSEVDIKILSSSLSIIIQIDFIVSQRRTHFLQRLISELYLDS